jgi:uncharacterized membrane protein YbhN (UPF0104 family)
MSAAASREDDEVFGIERRTAFVALGLAAVLGLGALALLSSVTDVSAALDSLRAADATWFAALAAGQLLAYAGYSFGYRVMARACGGPCLPWWTTIRLTILSFGAYILATSAGGLALDTWALTRAGEDVHRAGRRMLGFNILEWAVLSAFACAAAVAVLLGAGSGAPLPMTLAWLTGVPAAVAAAAWISSPRRHGRFTRLPSGEPEDPGWRPGPRLAWLWVEIRKGFADAIGGLAFLRMMIPRSLRYRGAPLGFAVYWAGDLLTMYAALRAVGVEIDAASLVLAYATGYVVTSAPLPAGAAGFSEATTAYALHAVGVPLGNAVLAVFLYRFATFWAPLVPAVAMTSRARAISEELPGVDREADPPCELRPEAS